MSAHQMVCHLDDAFRMAIGREAGEPASGPLQRTVVKWIALYVPLPWPPGILTRPEIDQGAGGTPPADFAADVAELGALVELLTAQPRAHVAAASDLRQAVRGAWLRWAYLHTDHHLRQFGA